MIVLDLGCRNWGTGMDSIAELVDYYAPELLLGYDVLPDVPEGVTRVGHTTIVQTRAAAWTHNTSVRYLFDGTSTRVDNSGGEWVQGFDIAALITALPPADLVVKMDIEGAEYAILPHLLHRGVAVSISELLVEWHPVRGDATTRARVLEDWPGVIREWWL